MTESKVTTSSRKAHDLDAESQLIRDSAHRKYTVALVLGIIAFSILFTVGVVGLYKQNENLNRQEIIAKHNQQHIDCIVKLFTTPLPANARSRSISNPATTCNIQFNQ